MSHYGSSPDSGHYKAYVIRQLKWFECDDSYVKPADLHKDVVVGLSRLRHLKLRLLAYRANMHTLCSTIEPTSPIRSNHPVLMSKVLGMS